jgi:hypothetical protein
MVAKIFLLVLMFFLTNRPFVLGSMDFRVKTYAALGMLEPARYDHINFIIEGKSNSAWLNDIRLVTVIKDQTTVYIAGVIAHENCHQMQNSNGWLISQISCLSITYDTLVELGAPQYDLDYILSLIHAK